MEVNTEWILPFIAPHRTWWWPRLPRHRVGVCMLHSVGNRMDLPDCPSNNAIEPEKLHAVIGLLRAAGYAFTTFGAAFGSVKPDRTCPVRRRMVLTFDDGFADNLTNLLPILREFNVPATCFVTNRGQSSPEFLSGAQILKLDQSGLVEIGGHTAHHCCMLHADIETARREIRRNKDWLEGILGHPVVSFAYPRGEYNDAIVAAVRAAGYRCAATMEKHLRPPPRDAFHIHRQILPRGKTPAELYMLATRGKYKL